MQCSAVHHIDQKDQQVQQATDTDSAAHPPAMASASTSRVVSLALCLCLGALAVLQAADAARAFFVFGDSLVDNGNNNYLLTEARADSPPYGIDTPDHRATGRFSNGKNVPDIIS